LDNHPASVALLRLLFTFVPEPRSVSFRNPRSTSPEYPVCLSPSMKIEFRKAIIPEEIPALLDFDKKAFHAYPADLSLAEEWGKWESYWVLLSGEVVGCISMEVNQKEELWIASTGLLPEFRGRGLGNELKQWEIDYAKNHGYPLIGTMMRQSNEEIIGLNKKFGFTVRKVMPGKYDNPDEPGIVMELRVK